MPAAVSQQQIHVQLGTGSSFEFDKIRFTLNFTEILSNCVFQICKKKQDVYIKAVIKKPDWNQTPTVATGAIYI